MIQDNQDIKFSDIFKSTSVAGWVLMCRPLITLLFSRNRDLSAYSAVDATAFIFIVYAIVASIVGYRQIRGSNSLIGIALLKRSPIYLFLLYCVLGVVSMIWSVNPMLTGFRAFECTAMMLLIVAVIQDLFERGGIEYAIYWTMAYCTYLCIMDIVSVAKWSTNFWDLIAASQMVSTVFFFFALYIRPRRWYNYLIMILAFFSMSTVSYVGMAIGMISAFWEKRSRVLTIAVAYCLLLVAIWVGPYKLFKDTIFFDKNEISLQETSGRDHLYEATLESVNEHPWGLGFFSAEPYILYQKNLGAISAHNSLFSAGLGMGIPGIVLMALFFFAMGKISFSRYIPENLRAIVIGSYLGATVQCMGNPSVGTRVYGAWTTCMFVYVFISMLYVYEKYYKTETLNCYENNLGNKESIGLSDSGI